MLTKTKIKIKNTILAIIVTVVAIFVPSLLLCKIVEGIIFFFCHWLIREQFPKQYHCATHAMCRALSGTVFFLGVCFILPLSYSVLFAIPINYFISWVGYVKKQVNELEAENMLLQSKLEKLDEPIKPIDITNCSEQELLKRCKQLHLTKYATEMAVNIFIRKLTTEQLSKLYYINKRSVTIQKARLKKKLYIQ